MDQPKLSHVLLILALFILTYSLNAQTANISGELKKWHTVTLTFDGPSADENGNPNPFMDYRLQVTFTNGANRVTVPGYFAADGNAANTGSTRGNKWRVHFAPDQTGTWSYTVSFRQGREVAVSLDANSGTAVTALDGLRGTFQVGPSDKVGRDFRSKGRLIWNNSHYWQFQGSDEYFLKGGLDSPENFFGCTEFDNTSGFRTHDWGKHKRDWRNGDPSWKSGQGKGIVGAVNYLADKGLNSIGPITMAVNGDVSGIYPFISSNQRDRFDCSRLDQWQIVVDHANKNGLHIQFKLSEHENYNLEGTNLNSKHKIYYREMVARFGHYLGISWNIGEEFGTSGNPYNQFARELAGYLDAVNPFPQNITIHNWGGRENQVFEPQMGNNSSFTGTSLQGEYYRAHRMVLEMRRKSADKGKPWIIAHDEQPPFNKGVPPDGLTASNPASPNQGTYTQDDVRQEGLWGHMMAGGAGMEWFWGTDWPGNQTDFDGDDYRSRDRFWNYVRYALEFFQSYLPFHQMENADNLIGNSSNSNDKYCFAKKGEVYAIYLPNGGSTNLDLGGTSGNFSVQWYNPREGGALRNGNVASVQGGGNVSIGNAPSSGDWVALVQKEGGNTGTPFVRISNPLPNSKFTEGDTISLAAEVRIANRSISKVTFYANNRIIGTDSNAPYAIDWPEVAKGTYQITATAEEESGLSGTSAPVFIEVLGENNDGGGNSGGDQEGIPCDATFVEKGGIIVIEAENAKLNEGWVERTDAIGYTGRSYIEYTGPNYLGTPGNGLLEYKIQINTPGTYRFDFRNKVGRGDDTSEHNDSWVRFPDADDFYGELDGYKAYPNGVGKSPIFKGSTSEGWGKVYLYGTTEWTWRTKVSDHEGLHIYADFNNPGVYTLQISGRSNGHFIDRMVLYHSSVDRETAINDALPESTCDGSDIPGNPGGDLPAVSISSPNNGDSFSVGEKVNIVANATAADGASISKVVFYQGSQQLNEDITPPYTGKWEPTSAGNYSLTAVAYDDQDRKRTSTPVNVTVLTPDQFHIIPGKIEAEAYADMLGIQTEPSSEGTDNVGWFDSGDWIDYKVDVQSSGNYDVTFRVASNNGDGTFQLQQNGSVLATIDVPNTGAFQTYTDVLVEDVPLEEGKQTLRIYSVTKWFNLNYFTFSTDDVPPPPPPTPEEVMVSLLTPEDEASSVSPTPTFSWTTDVTTELEGFQFMLGDSIITLSNDTSYQWKDSLKAGTYAWKVRAITAPDVYSAWSSKFTFTIPVISTPPDEEEEEGDNPVSLISPEDNSIVTDSIPLFTWSIGNKDSLENYIFSLNGAVREVSKASLYQWENALSAGEYKWRVRAQWTNGSFGPWSSTFTFTIPESDTLAPTPTPIDSSYALRINVGGPSYTAPNGDFFQADQYATGESKIHDIGNEAIAGTDHDLLYQTERWGESYGMAIPTGNGTFDITLHFAEIYWNANGARLFDVDIENGSRLMEKIDIHENVGAKAAMIERIQGIKVEDGVLNLDMFAYINNAQLCAIEITGNLQSPTAGPDPLGQVIRINAGGSEYTTSSGHTFEADQYYQGSSLIYAISEDIAGTVDDPIYQSERYGVDFSYQIPVQNDTFDLVLHFAEIFWREPGKRLFDVDIEGQASMVAVDIVDEIGARGAYKKIFRDIIVTDGVFSIEFETALDNAKLSALEIVPAGILPEEVSVDDPTMENVVRINAGAEEDNMFGGYLFYSDRYYSSNTKSFYNTGIADIAETNFDDLYRSERVSQNELEDFSYQIPIPNGSYVVYLHFAEIWWGAVGGDMDGPGKRVFNVNLEGNPIMRDFDLNQEKGTMTAIYKKIEVTVTDNQLNLDFSASEDKPTISAIEVLPLDMANQTVALSPGYLNDFIDPSDPGADPNGLIQRVNIAPNPATDHSWLTIEGDLEGAFQVEVIDMMGRLLKVFDMEKSRFIEQYKIPLNQMAEGIYFIRVRQGSVNLTKRLWKR